MRALSSSQSTLVVVPPGAPGWVTAELIGQTINVWSPRFGRALTTDEALDIIMSVGELNRVLTGAPQDETLCRPGPCQ